MWLAVVRPAAAPAKSLVGQFPTGVVSEPVPPDVACRLHAVLVPEPDAVRRLLGFGVAE